MADITTAVVGHEPAAHSPHHLHHFATPEQQMDAATLGMWTFLVTEVLFFGGVFAAYAVYRNMYPAAFASAMQYMNLPLGALNTIILLCSSLTMGLAVRAAQLGRNKGVIRLVTVTLVLGTVFLCIKGYEYHSKWVENLIPGPSFHYDQPQFAHNVEILFFLYFVMTGMHAVHMIIGMGLLVYLILKARMGTFSPAYFTPVEMIGLYWHFVDVVWTFLFPLLYLIGHRA